MLWDGVPLTTHYFLSFFFKGAVLEGRVWQPRGDTTAFDI